MKPERSKIKSDILLRVRLLYVLFILAGGVVLVRLVWVQLFSAEVAYNADRLSSRIFTEEVIPAQRGSILSRDGEPLATSIFRYQAAFDFASPGLDSLRTFREQADSLSKLLAAFFGDRPASEYARMFREEHARRYRLVNPRDTQYLRSEGWLSRMLDRLRGEEYVTRRIYDTIRDHTPVAVFPREVDYAEWEVLRRYPLLNWNMGMVYRLVERDERIYPQGELARRTIGLTGDKGNYGIEEAYRAELAGRDGRAVRQRIARGFYGRVAGAGHEDPEDGYDVVTTLDLDLQDVADKALRQQLERQNALWGTTIVMETRTGEILALANLGRNADGSFAERENYALSRSMEPGSTFKLATMLTLLDDARMPVTTVYDTHNGDPVKIGPARNIRDSHRGDREIDFRRAVASSSNVYFAEAVWDRYGITGRKQRYSDYLRDELHLGETVGLERLGERAPSITSDWKVPDPGVMLVKMAYGYRVRLTPIQMITFYNAVANEGRMISPVLVRELRRGDRVEERFESRTIPRRLFAADAAHRPRVFAGGLHRGHGQRLLASTTRVRVAAKTGTAQITDARSREGALLPGVDGGFLPGRCAALYGADDDRDPGAGGQGLLRRAAGGPRRQAHGRLHLQPRPRLVRPGRRRRSAPLSRAGEGRRHRPDPPRGRPPLAPRLVRQPHGLGPRRGGQPLERGDHEPAGRPGRDARRARHGAEGRAVRAREPRAEGPLLGAGSRRAAEYRRRDPHPAGRGGRHNVGLR